MNIQLRAKLSAYSQTSLEGVDEAVAAANSAVAAANSAAENANNVAEGLIIAKEEGQFNGPQGEQGVQGLPGLQGVSITGITFITTQGLITSGTAYFSDGSTSPITIQEGE